MSATGHKPALWKMRVVRVLMGRRDSKRTVRLRESITTSFTVILLEFCDYRGTYILLRDSVGVGVGVGESAHVTTHIHANIQTDKKKTLVRSK